MDVLIEPAVEQGCLKVALCGEVDQHVAQQLRVALQLLLQDETITRMQVDMLRVSLMDSSGIGLLVGWHRTLAQRGGLLCLYSVQPAVSRVLRLSGMYSILEIVEAA